MAVKLLNTKFLLCLFLVCYFANKGTCAPEEETARTTESARNLLHTHHILKINSLLPSNVCTPASTQAAHHGKASLKLVHKHGPCFQQKKPNGENRNTPTDNLKTLLEQDQSRINSIQSRLAQSGSGRQQQQQQQKGWHTDSVNPVNSNGQSLGSGNYLVMLGLGTPRRQVSLIFDTIYSLSWTQCQPCLGYCYKQKDPIFRPTLSATYEGVACYSEICNYLETDTTTGFAGCDRQICTYNEKYTTGVSTGGYLSRDRLTLTPYDVVDGFVFGCGMNNRGDVYGDAAGLLGLGRARLSFVSQTARRYDQRFSYCVPAYKSTSGFLSFGSYNPEKPQPRGPVEFTPMSQRTENAAFYGIDMTGISVAGAMLPIPSSVFARAGTVIDSGTELTWLPPAAYEELRWAFQRMMARYPRAKGYQQLDTCYDFSGYSSVSVPKISFFFSGEVEVESHVAGTLYQVSWSQVCLAFVANQYDNQFGVFGNRQQKTYEVLYDVTRSRIGFAASAC